ncbi:phage holin family protein [Planctomicrobium sp. SH668]|uniref:phage holin family protein n=1 Tax=Planctomicrobium sp. SH668 TaxID=3448126 RepID=UPI003F5C3FC4
MDQTVSGFQHRTGLGDRGGSGAAYQEEDLNGRPKNAYASARNNAATLAQDLLRLADLQLQLATLDLTEFWSKAKFGLVVCVVGAVTILGAVPVILMALANFVHTHTSLSVEVSQILVAVGALVIGVIFLAVSVKFLTRAGECLNRSKKELRENIEWLRDILKRDDE